MIRIPNRFTRQMLDGHGLLGVVFGAVVYMLCLSGTLIVLVDQLTRWESPAVPAVSTVSPARMAAVGEAAWQRARAADLKEGLYLNLPTEDLPRLSAVALGKGEDHAEWSIDADGRIGEEVALPWVEFVEVLHFNLTVPGALGRYLVGIIGTLLLASIGTGILAHRRIFKDAFRLRWGGSPRRSHADLHNRIGLWALPFHLIVSLTGSLLGLSGLIIFVLATVAYGGDSSRAIASLLGPQPTPDFRAAPLPDILPMIARVEREAPGAALTQVFIHQPGTVGQTVQVSAAAPRHLSRNEAWTFAGNGRLLAKAGLTDGSVGMRVYGMISPLHYGTYGGVPLKLIYVVLGLGLTIIVATGGRIWLSRRREQGRAAPRLERVWTALVWGQPLVLLLTIPAAWAGWPTAAYWAATLLGWAAALAVRDPARLADGLRLAIGLVAIAVALAHSLYAGLADTVAVVVDLGLLAIGAGFVAKHARVWRPVSGLPGREGSAARPAT